MTAARGPVVWVVQEPHHRDEQGVRRPSNTTSALAFGSLELLLEDGKQASVLNAAAVVRQLQARLAKYQDGDYILAAGDPAAIGIACAIAAIRGGGVFTVLKWDRQEACYYAVPIDLRRIT